MTLVIFDIDGTLTDTKEVDDYCYINSLKQVWGTEPGHTDWSVFPDVTDAGLARDIFKTSFKKEIDMESLQALKSTFFRKIISELSAHPEKFRETEGARAFIERLKSRQIGVAFATGGWECTAAIKLRAIGIEMGNFPYATSDDSCAREEILKMAVNRAGIFYGRVFRKVFYIGDGIWDLNSAKNSGIEFIGIDTTQNGKLSGAGVKNVFRNFGNPESLLSVILKEKNNFSFSSRLS